MNRLFVNNLTVIDFSFLDPIRGIVGESWIVDVELEGELDEQGMVFDFGHVKKQLKNLIDDEVDHKLAIPAQLEGVLIERSENRIDVGYQNSTGEKWLHRSPASAVLLIEEKEITPESVSTFLIDLFDQVLPDNVDGVSITIRPEEINGAYYHYSHGLKKHLGNCQRIAHGHRSRIEIYLNQQRQKVLETEWATKLQDSYVATLEDLSGQNEQTEISLGRQTGQNITFNYVAQQGQFELTLPARQVYIIDTDSTVEWIACHIAENLQETFPNDDIQVRAYEGVGKGSIAER
ncbi:queuosine biosynthesis protein QueD [Oleiphilus messinensis]|uniref:6-carboxy-5,6,7,8-tetrahydropterin synthase n=1 Tax=Oleiphilus messinensis TaxID=141451 RepID=A0A1Y0I7T8_9GAMM|nr:6-carboxytetrahydropterin synthase [Oleiphilus messinensis]ARU56259.1 queuosine biosynthesis protein QueD [Oleiphilus messinensis]